MNKPLKLDVTFDVPKVLAELGEEVKKRDALLRECLEALRIYVRHIPLTKKIREAISDD